MLNSASREKVGYEHFLTFLPFQLDVCPRVLFHLGSAFILSTEQSQFVFTGKSRVTEGRSPGGKCFFGVGQCEKAVPGILYRDVIPFIPREGAVSYEDNLIVQQAGSAALTRKISKLTESHGALVGHNLQLPALRDNERGCRLADEGRRLFGRVPAVSAGYHWVLI